MSTCGAPGVVDVRDSDDEQHLEVTMHLGSFGSIVDQLEQVRSLFGLRHDVVAAESALRRDKLLGSLLRRHPGTRLAGSWGRFETAVRIIVGQQVSVAGASTVCGRIAERFGERVSVQLPGELRCLFPSPEVLAKADLAGIGMPSARARTIVAFAQSVASGDLDLGAATSLEDACAKLEVLPGIGPWTSNLIAARVMEHADAFASSDLGLRKGAALLLGKVGALSTRQLEALAERWRPYRTTAMAHLWRAALQTSAGKEASK